MNIPQFTKRNIFLAVAVVFGIAIIGFVAVRTSHSGEVGLRVVVLPDDSTFTIDGHGARAGKVYVTKGKHVFKASKKGFKEAKVDIDTATIDSNRTIYLLPAPDSEEAFAWLANHPEAQERREAAAGAEVVDIQKDVEKTPLVDQLPFTAPGFEFIIDYTTEKSINNTTEVIIIVKASNEEARQNARNWIEQQGTKVSSLNIRYEANDAYDSFDNPEVGHQ
jgi:hypothetical protein